MKAKDQPTESARLSKVLEYGIIMVQSEDPELQRIVKMATMISGCPFSYISLIDSKTQYIKSKIGIDINLKEIPLEHSFCNEIIERRESIVIENIHKQNCFDKNPIKTNYPEITFYAGIPLKTSEDHIIGSLCIMDTSVRILSELQKLSLEVLSYHVMDFFKLQNMIRIDIQKEKIISNNKNIETFYSNLTHELRTPLNAFYGYVEILLNTSLDSEQFDMLMILKSSCEILITLVNDILDFSKLENGKIELENKPFNLVETITKLKAMLNSKCVSKGIALKLNLDNKITKYLNGDMIRLNQILTNLIGNAIKFTPTGSVEVKVTIKEDTDTYQRILFKVIDTGIGIENTMVDKLFNRYQQCGSDIFRRFGGTGLGLNIAKNLVEVHEGELKLTSIYGKGTEFFFEIIYKKSSKDEVNLLEDLQKAEKKIYYNFKGKNILVCEDNKINIKLISKILKDEGIDFIIAENGLIALELFKKHTFNIVLMDLNMPEMNGFETTIYIRSTLKLDIPIIALTANASEEEKRQCIKLGMNDYVTKPFKIDFLVNKLIYFCIQNEIDIPSDMNYARSNSAESPREPKEHNKVKNRIEKQVTNLNRVDKNESITLIPIDPDDFNNKKFQFIQENEYIQTFRLHEICNNIDRQNLHDKNHLYNKMLNYKKYNKRKVKTEIKEDEEQSKVQMLLDSIRSNSAPLKNKVKQNSNREGNNQNGIDKDIRELTRDQIKRSLFSHKISTDLGKLTPIEMEDEINQLNTKYSKKMTSGNVMSKDESIKSILDNKRQLIMAKKQQTCDISNLSNLSQSKTSTPSSGNSDSSSQNATLNTISNKFTTVRHKKLRPVTSITRDDLSNINNLKESYGINGQTNKKRKLIPKTSLHHLRMIKEIPTQLDIYPYNIISHKTTEGSRTIQKKKTIYRSYMTSHDKIIRRPTINSNFNNMYNAVNVSHKSINDDYTSPDKLMKKNKNKLLIKNTPEANYETQPNHTTTDVNEDYYMDDSKYETTSGPNTTKSDLKRRNFSNSVFTLGNINFPKINENNINNVYKNQISKGFKIVSKTVIEPEKENLYRNINITNSSNGIKKASKFTSHNSALTQNPKLRSSSKKLKTVDNNLLNFNPIAENNERSNSSTKPTLINSRQSDNNIVVHSSIHKNLLNKENLKKSNFLNTSSGRSENCKSGNFSGISFTLKKQDNEGEKLKNPNVINLSEHIKKNLKVSNLDEKVEQLNTQSKEIYNLYNINSKSIRLDNNSEKNLHKSTDFSLPLFRITTKDKVHTPETPSNIIFKSYTNISSIHTSPNKNMIVSQAQKTSNVFITSNQIIPVIKESKQKLNSETNKGVININKLRSIPELLLKKEEDFKIERIDLNTLIEMTGDDKDFILEIIKTFLTENPINMENLTNAVENKTFEKISFEAHTLKSSVAYLGLVEMQKNFNVIQDLCKFKRESDLEQIKSLLHQITRNLKETYKELEELKVEIQ